MVRSDSGQMVRRDRFTCTSGQSRSFLFVRVVAGAASAAASLPGQSASQKSNSMHPVSGIIPEFVSVRMKYSILVDAA
jgi:hypothetical protein